MPDKNCARCGGRGTWATCLDAVYDCDCKTAKDRAQDRAESLAYYKAQLDKAERDMDYYTKKIRELAG